MIRSILEWTDRKRREVVEDPETDLNDVAKNSLAAGFVEGSLDAFAVLGALVVAINVANVFKKRK